MVRHLESKGVIDLAETYIDASWVKAKNAPKVDNTKAGNGTQIMSIFNDKFLPLSLSRLSLLEGRFGSFTHETNLSELWVTKLTIATHSMLSLQEDIKSNLLLPISQIGSLGQLRMDEPFADTQEGGRSGDFFSWQKNFRRGIYAENYLGMVLLGASLIILRRYQMGFN